jgi:membrane protein implicated in regulation of membrane protease activity
MAAPLMTIDHPEQREEGFLHYLAREGRVALRWTIGICLVVTVMMMVTPIWFAAIVPAFFLAVAYVLFVLANEVERRSDVQAHIELEAREVAVVGDVSEDHAEDDRFAPDQAEIIKRESKTGVVILVAVSLAALIAAFIMFDLRLLAIGALVVFSYMLFIAAPFWLGWFNTDIEDEERRLHDQPQSASVRTE